MWIRVHLYSMHVEFSFFIRQKFLLSFSAVSLTTTSSCVRLYTFAYFCHDRRSRYASFREQRERVTAGGSEYRSCACSAR